MTNALVIIRMRYHFEDINATLGQYLLEFGRIAESKVENKAYSLKFFTILFTDQPNPLSGSVYLNYPFVSDHFIRVSCEVCTNWKIEFNTKITGSSDQKQSIRLCVAFSEGWESVNKSSYVNIRRYVNIRLDLSTNGPCQEIHNYLFNRNFNQNTF